MSEYSFTATARIPTRPLSYENKDLAEAKEILVDYNSHEIYVCGIDGKIVNVTASVTKVVQEVMAQIEQDPTIVGDATIELDDGTTVVLSESIISMLADITTLKESSDKTNKALNKILDDDGNVVVTKPENITTDETHRFATDAEKKAWNEKTNMVQITTLIPSGESKWTSTDGEAPYTQRVTVSNIKSTDYPVVDVKLSDVYSDAMDELDNYAYIYKILTYDGYIVVYATKPTEKDLNIIMKVDR